MINIYSGKRLLIRELAGRLPVAGCFVVAALLLAYALTGDRVLSGQIAGGVFGLFWVIWFIGFVIDFAGNTEIRREGAVKRRVSIKPQP